MRTTPLDHAAAGMTADAEEAVRRRFHERLADTELYVILESEASGERVSPRVFETSQGRYAVAFDLAERLAGFTSQPTPTMTIAGRALMTMLAGRGIGLGINPGVAPSSHLLPPEAVDWIAMAAGAQPSRRNELPQRFGPAGAISPALKEALRSKLNAIAGVAGAAYLATGVFLDGRRSVVISLFDVPPALHKAVATAVTDAVVFCGEAPAAPDVLLLASRSPEAWEIRKVGDPLELVRPDPPTSSDPGPGRDPAEPPRLR